MSLRYLQSRPGAAIPPVLAEIRNGPRKDKEYTMTPYICWISILSC